MNKQQEPTSSSETSVESLKHDNLTITVKIDGVLFQRSLTDDLRVDEDQINRWLKEQPTKMAYWSVWLGRAEIVKLEREHILKKAEGLAYGFERKRLYEEYKANYAKYFNIETDNRTKMPKPKEPTADAYKYAVVVNENYQDAVQALIRSSEVVKYMKSAVSAINEMRSTLMSLSANMRAERDSYGNTYGKNAHKQVNEASDSIAKSFKNSVGSIELNSVAGKQDGLNNGLPIVPDMSLEQPSIPTSVKKTNDYSLLDSIDIQDPKKKSVLDLHNEAERLNRSKEDDGSPPF